MEPVVINHETCIGCGACGIICPRHIPETKKEGDKKVTSIHAERADLCMLCGQCAAVCPTDSVSVSGLAPEEFKPLEPLELDGDQLLRMFRQRRSVRRYKDQPVEREVLDRIIEAAHAAPTGAGKRSVGLVVVDNPERLKKLSDLAYGMYRKLGKALANPIARFFIKRKAGAAKLGTLENFVMPGMRWYLRWREEGKGDELSRDAPVLMVFHSPIMAPVADENCLIAATHALFMAQTLGVGGFFNGLFGPAINRDSEMRKILGLSTDREVYACLGLGYGKFKYRKTIPRRLAEVRYLD